MTLRVHPDEIVAAAPGGLLAAHSSWERVRLGEVATVLNGFAFKSELFSKTDGVPLLRIRDVGKEATDVRFAGGFNAEYLVRAGDQVIGMDGDFRTARWAGTDALLNQRVCKVAVRDSSQYDGNFLLYVLPGYLSAINQRTSAITVKHLSSRTVAEIPLPLPPLLEQRRIVAAIEEQFSRLDAADESLKRVDLRAEAMRRGVLGSAFAGCPSRELGDLAATQLGKMLSQKARTGVGSRPYLRNKNVQWGRIDTDDLLRMDFSDRDVAKFSLAPGDVLVCEGGEVGRAAIWHGEVPECCFQKALHRVRCGPDLLPQFLVHAMRWLSDVRAFDRYVTGSTIKHLPQEGLRLVRIPAPPVDAQARILAEVEQRLSVIDAMRAAVGSGQRRSASLRRSILERAFRGELVDQDPSDEPASVLLERVRAERAEQPKPRRTRRAGATRAS